MIDEDQVTRLHPVAEGIARLKVPYAVPETGSLRRIPQVVERKRRWLGLQEPVLPGL